MHTHPPSHTVEEDEFLSGAAYRKKVPTLSTDTGLTCSQPFTLTCSWWIRRSWVCLSGRTWKKTWSAIFKSKEKQKQRLKPDLLPSDIKTQLSKPCGDYLMQEKLKEYSNLVLHLKLQTYKAGARIAFVLPLYEPHKPSTLIPGPGPPTHPSFYKTVTLATTISTGQ